MINLIIEIASVLTVEASVGYYNDASIGINDGKIIFTAEQIDSILNKFEFVRYISEKYKLESALDFITKNTNFLSAVEDEFINFAIHEVKTLMTKDSRSWFQNKSSLLKFQGKGYL